MKKLLLLILVLVFITGFHGPAYAEKAKIPSEKILTAIDVVVLIESGSSDEDLSTLLSEQRGFDRASALKKGKTDRQIIKDLIAGTTNKENMVDTNKSTHHRIQGDKYYKEAKYDKAAMEYTLAMMHSQDNHELYKLRGDSYKQYYMIKFPSLPGTEVSASQKTSLDKKRMLLCCCIESDYNKALQINNAAILNNDIKIKVIQDRMGTKTVSNENNSEVQLRYKRASGNIAGMRQLDVLYNAQRLARYTDINLKKAMSEHKVICRGENTFCQE